MIFGERQSVSRNADKPNGILMILYHLEKMTLKLSINTMVYKGLLIAFRRLRKSYFY